jgi:hypothetical protein
MCDIPLEVTDEENVVRAVFSNHLEGKKLRKTVFFDRRDEASVMRHSHQGSDECKKKALRVVPGDPKLKYKGLAVINVGSVRKARSEVFDSRAVYCGHAHISHGIAVPPAGDPLMAEQKFQLDERLRTLKDLAQYYPDDDSTAATWTGQPF